jgi:hypothetical protein
MTPGPALSLVPTAGTPRGKSDSTAAGVVDLARQLPLSNRRGIGSKSEPEGSWEGFGVDRLSVSFPLAGEPDREAFQVVQDRRAHSDDTAGSATMGATVPLHLTPVEGKRTKVTAGVFVGAAQVGGSWWGKVEANPSRFGDPDGCSLLPLDGLPGAVQTMVDAASSLGLRSTESVEDWRVKRVDLARDVRGVPDPSGLLWGLLPLHRPYARHQTVWADPSHRGAQTLWVGSGAGGCRLYDQHEAYSDKGAERGSVRWELEARDEWISREVRAGGANVGAVLEHRDRLVSLAMKRWEWSKMGATVTASSEVIAKVEALIQVGGFIHDGQWVKFTPARAKSFLGALLMASHGRSGVAAKATNAYHAKVLAHLGVVMSPRLFAEQDDAPVGRLDWHSGEWVAA